MNYLHQKNQIELEAANYSPAISASTHIVDDVPQAKPIKNSISLVRLGFDYGLIYLAFLFSYFLRFNWFNFDNAQLRTVELDKYFILGAVFSITTAGLLGVTKMYMVPSQTRFLKQAFLMAGVVLSSIAVITLLQLLDQPNVFFSRLAFIFLAPVTWLILSGEVLTVTMVKRLLHVHQTTQATFVAKITSFRGEEFVAVEKSYSPVSFFIKRAIDFVGAVTVLVVFSIPLIIIALLVKLDSKGPVIFKQTRVGKNGKHFTFYKFRSMYTDAEEKIAHLMEFNETNGATFKMKNDPRITRVGRFLRKTSLDELPQLMNILLGQMSLVGPRPGLPREVACYEHWQHRRLETIPGLTGLWQVSGRSSIKFEDMTKLDIYYVDNYSLILDIKILLMTVLAVLTGKGAY